MELEKRVAVVTGAGGAIGRALSVAFAGAGARVVCAGRRMERLSGTVRAVEKAGGEALPVAVDTTDRAQVKEMVRRSLSAFGRIDVLFNNAGSFASVGPVWEADPDAWWRDVSVNLLGSMLCTREVLPHMMGRDAGVVINMDGGGGSNGPNVGGSAYGCSKAALLRFSEGLAKELEAVGSSVLVFVMMPGFVWSDMTRSLVDTPEKEKWQRHVKSLRGSQLELPPEACAEATLALLRIASPELSGRIFYVDTDYERVGKNKGRILEENLYVMRLATLDGLLGPWPRAARGAGGKESG